MRALLSVSDKTGLFDLAKGLADLGWELIASGATAKYLREQELPVTEVASYTQTPEMLGGRVKTLHPAIHGGLLARQTKADQIELEQLGWGYIDLVAVNLYPFEQTILKPEVTLEDAIENIDIGGVALIRAAAKNHERVTLLCDPNDYQSVLKALQQGAMDQERRRALAIKGFLMTTRYDSAIANFLLEQSSGSEKLLTLSPVQTLRYGENPHQQATLYGFSRNAKPLGGNLLQGKELSYNNLLDLDAAWRVVESFEKPTVAIIKHLSPSGVASAENLPDAFQAALASDPVSAFGGIIAVNREFDKVAAEALGKLFVEAIAAPRFSEEAKEILKKREKCRLLEMLALPQESHQKEYRSVRAGLVEQTVDRGDPDETVWKVVTHRAPTEKEHKALTFAWRVCPHVKSNAIVLVQNEATVGIGGGQPNRVDCVKMAGERAGEKAKGAALASDAFFPFPDGIEMAAALGVTAIIQPGGSIRDEEVIAVANKHNIAMIFTGIRHFRH